MRYEDSKRKIKTIWNNISLTDRQIEDLDFKYEIIKDKKILRSSYRNKKTKYYIQEGALSFDKYYGYWYVPNLIISLRNFPARLLPYVKTALLPLVPEELGGTILDSGAEHGRPIEFVYKSNTEYDLLVMGITCGYSDLDDFTYDDETEFYIERAMNYRLVVAIINPDEYF